MPPLKGPPLDSVFEHVSQCMKQLDLNDRRSCIQQELKTLDPATLDHLNQVIDYLKVHGPSHRNIVLEQVLSEWTGSGKEQETGETDSLFLEG